MSRRLWISVFLATSFLFALLSQPTLTAKTVSPLVLTPEEQQFLHNHPVLRLGVGTSFPPIMYVDEVNGSPAFQGIVSDYLQLVENRLGIRLEPVYGITFKEALKRGKAKQIDMFPCISKTAARSKFLSYTSPYIQYPLVIITRDDAPSVNSIEDIQDMRIAIVKSLANYDKLEGYNHKKFNYVFKKVIPDVLYAVSTGEADACIINLAVAAHEITRLGLSNLRVAAPTPWSENKLAMAVRNDWPILATILEKTLKSITQEEKDRIQKKWITLEYEQPYNTAKILQWLAVAVLAVVGIIGVYSFWVISLRKEIKKRIETEAALREAEQSASLSNRRMETLVSNLPGAAYQCLNDEFWTMKYLSKEIENITGYKPEELIDNKVIAYSDLIHPDDRDDVWNHVQDAYSSNTRFEIEYRLTNKINEMIFIWEAGRFTHDINGEECIEGFITDISERKTAEEQLLVSRKFEAIGLLSSGVAHEINTPMHYINGNLQFLSEVLKEYEEFISKQDFEEIKNALDDSKFGVDKVTKIVHAINVIGHRNTDNIKAVDLNEVVNNAIVVSQNSWKYHAEVKVNLADNIPTIQACPGEMEQIVLNLLINAAHTLEEKHSSQSTKGLLSVSTRFNGDSLFLEVADDGCGIPNENLQSIYDPFFTTKEQGKGTGQGLSIVYGLLKKYGGFIEVDTEVDKGTTFSIILPLLKARCKTSQKTRAL